jgi:hypothetical protein
MASRTPLKGLVAKILTSRELVINIGAKDGVAPGMVFKILDTKGQDIRDPETNDVLGSILRTKVVVRAVTVQERLTLCETFRSRRANVGGTGVGNIARMFQAPRWVDEYETLKTTEATWEDLDESQSYVKPGDPVEQVLEADSPEVGSFEK